LILLAVAASAPARAADPGTPDRLRRFFESWYTYFPGSTVAVTPLPDFDQPGLSAFRAERKSSSPAHQESSVALWDGARQEVLVGDVFADPDRRRSGKPFDPATDLPNVQASLAEAFGLPVRATRAGPARGPLEPLRIDVRQRADAILSRDGFASKDGSLIALGEFVSVPGGVEAFRRRLLGERPGVRQGSGRFTVTEFLDFQCERCRARAPEVEKAVAERGGTVEARFLPLVRNHDWAFAAAESAAALAALDAALYPKYRAAVFARAESLNPEGCRDLARDLAESAGIAARFHEEIASGRARDRVLADMRLAARIGVSITPTFVFDGTLLSGEAGLLETRLFERLGGAGAKR
jgi:hypothetical protein